MPVTRCHRGDYAWRSAAKSQTTNLWLCPFRSNAAAAAGRETVTLVLLLRVPRRPSGAPARDPGAAAIAFRAHKDQRAITCHGKAAGPRDHGSRWLPPRSL